MVDAMSPSQSDVPGPETDTNGHWHEGAGLPALAPDHSEQDMAGAMDDVIPAQGFEATPVVGLGGSAGSLGPLQTFFSKMPVDSGMAFVVVMHLSPDYESNLASLLGHTTTMPVTQVTGPVKVQVNHVYVIPPGKQISMVDGELELLDLHHERGRRVTVDLFFRTLADTHGPHSAGIVLSGADGDGASGLKRIKERGGLTVAQDPSEAEHDSMPRSAIGTGMVDWVLPIADMPARLVEYRRNEERLQLPPEDPQPAVAAAQPDEHEAALRDVLGFLRLRTGRDFSYYKRATILRRVARRMQVNSVTDLPGYLGFLRTHPFEATALLQDVLISVTNFFRDRESFEALEREIPRLFKDKGPEDQVRVWVAGCATGEEAYSVAMLLSEHAAKLDVPPRLQVFATDIDELAIRSARDGFYLDTIVADVSQERLRQFFTREPGGYRVQRAVRDMVLFAPHDLLKDSPFSRLDLVTCRNLLIYLNRKAQENAFDLFHFALRPDGRLFLGTSETADDAGTLFSPLDKKYRLYQRLHGSRLPLPMFSGPPPLALALGKFPVRGLALVPVAPKPASPLLTEESNSAPASSWSELHFRLLEHLAPPSVVVDRDYRVLHLSEKAGHYLQFRGGEPSKDLLLLVHPGLRVKLRAALFRARQTNHAVVVPGVPVELDGQARTVTLRVSVVSDLTPDYLLVVFDESGPENETPLVLARGSDPVSRQLEEELDHLKAERRETVEQYEASTKELKASNEELQAINEELRSATEELETSREELQSINEELITVNQELKISVGDFSRANSDLQNLMASTNIATVFLDRQLRIKRFTPAAVNLFSLIPGDVGRPLSDLQPRLEYADLAADAERVLDDLKVIEREVRGLDGGWFFARLLPYRTQEDRIAGVVLAFVDITERKRAQAGWSDSETRVQAMFGQATAGIVLLDLTGRFTYVNGRFNDMLGYADPELLGRNMLEIVHPNDRAREQAHFQRLAGEGIPFDIEKRYLRKDGSIGWVHNSASVLRDTMGRLQSCFAISIDITQRVEGEGELLALRDKLTGDLHATTRLYDLIFNSARDFAIYTLDRAGFVTSWNPGAETITGYPAAEMMGRSAESLHTPEDQKSGAFQQELASALRDGHTYCERWKRRRDGNLIWGSGVLTPLVDNGETIGFLKIERDATTQREAQEARREIEEERARLLVAERHARQEAETNSAAKDRFLASLSHELRTPLAPMQMAIFALEREKRLSASGREMIKMIGRNLEAEVQLIDELLDVSRIVHGKLEFKPAPMDVHECIHRAVEVCGADIEAKKLRLTVDLGAAQHATVGDTARLRQAFWNLLKNAAKFTPAGGTITVRTSNPGPDEFAVEIADTGIGIDPAVLPKIFSAFEQGNAQITQRYGGLGLGLAISQAVVQAHDGTLSAASAGLDRGATFMVRLPLSSSVE